MSIYAVFRKSALPSSAVNFLNTAPVLQWRRSAPSCSVISLRWSTSNYKPRSSSTIDPDVTIEEETLPHYKAERYYPVNIGDLFHQRYRVIGKLGYGTASTVWLCHDVLQSQKQYVALKVWVNGGKPLRELSIYQHINSLDSQHDGRDHIRKLVDSFVISGPHGEHTCLVHEALGMNLEDLQDLIGVFPADLLRQGLREILRGMQFLHQEAEVVHTDIQPKNILMGVLGTDTAFSEFEQDELDKPFPRKELLDRTIYVSQPMRITKGLPSLCDLSEARFNSPENHDLVMPDAYRAPEVVLDMPWSYPIDVWGFAMTLWDLFEPRKVFYPYDEDRRYSEALHLAQMTSVMGPPPPDFLARSEQSRLFWDANGAWVGVVPIPKRSLESEESRLQGEEKLLFLAFMRKMLQWRPGDRSSVEDILKDEWLLADLIAMNDAVPESAS